MRKAKASTLNSNLSGRELKKDIGIARRYLKFLLLLSSIALMMVYYSYMNFKLDKEITTLSLKKQYLVAENFKLKQEITTLSSPKRIDKIAKSKFKMKPVKYKEVKFLEMK